MNQITRLRKDRAAEPVLAESLKDQAYEAIKHRIITCAFKPGQELSESAVAGLLKIGRTLVAAMVHFAGRPGSSGQRQRSAPPDLPGDQPPRGRGCRERNARAHRLVS